MHAIKANYVMLAMLLLAVVAFTTGPVFFRNQTFPDVPENSLAYLETGVQLGMIDPPLLWQVQLVEARVTGPDRFDVEGTAVWRTLFGLPVGVVHSIRTDAPESSVDWQKMMRVWLAFLLAEGAMSTYCVWWIRTYWW